MVDEDLQSVFTEDAPLPMPSETKRARKVKPWIIVLIVLIAIKLWPMGNSAEDEQTDSVDSMTGYVTNDHVWESEEYSRGEPVGEAYPDWFRKIGEPAYVKRIWSMIKTLPPSLLQYIEENDYLVVLVGEDYFLEKHFDMESVAGIFTGYIVYAEATVSSCYDEQDSWCFIQDSVCHELGHVADESLEWISSEEEFSEIHSQEMQEYANTDQFYVGVRGVWTCIDTPGEYFASTFACYVLAPEELEKNCPQTYAFMDARFGQQ